MTRPRSDHFDGRRFFNPNGPALQPISAAFRMMRERRESWPARIDQPLRQPAALENSSAVVTLIGHSTILIQTAAGNILTDPIYSQVAGPFNLLGPRRVRQPAIAIDELPEISVVLLSHNHYDHCDLKTLRLLSRRSSPVVVTPIGNASLVQSAGIRQVVELDWWQHADVAGVSITSTPAFHFSARGLLDRNRALWSGFMLSVNGVRIYFAGDTAYGPFFRDIPSRVGPIDLALLPIGAYEPRWFMKNVHMNPAEAVQAYIDLGSPRSIAMHFGTFQLTTEGIDDPPRELSEALTARGIPSGEFAVIEPGEPTRIEPRTSRP